MRSDFSIKYLRPSFSLTVLSWSVRTLIKGRMQGIALFKQNMLLKWAGFRELEMVNPCRFEGISGFHKILVPKLYQQYRVCPWTQGFVTLLTKNRIYGNLP